MAARRRVGATGSGALNSTPKAGAPTGWAAGGLLAGVGDQLLLGLLRGGLVVDGRGSAEHRELGLCRGSADGSADGSTDGSAFFAVLRVVFLAARLAVFFAGAAASAPPSVGVVVAAAVVPGALRSAASGPAGAASLSEGALSAAARSAAGTGAAAFLVARRLARLRAGARGLRCGTLGLLAGGRSAGGLGLV